VKHSTCQTALLLILVLLASGCASLNSTQRSELQAMRRAGVSVEEKKPILAATLGVLPGGGSFYTRQWGLGVVDVLLWPSSILWDPVAGYQGAEAINYDASRAYAKELKQREVAQLEEQLAYKQIDQVAFIQGRRSIDEKFDF
jgi:hypothetical protein